MRIDGKTRLAGVVGWPVGHSRSPFIHNYWLNKYRINGAYLPFPVAPERFETAIAGLHAAGLAGVNVTLPHKEAAFALCDTHDAAAEATGAVNTLIFKDNSIEGRNTDAPGFVASLYQAVPDWNAGAGKAVVLGAGGAARAIVWALLEAGVPRVAIVNRSAARAEALVKTFGARVCHQPQSDLQDYGLLVNATSLGMTGQPSLDFPLDGLPVDAIVSDIVYAPLRTSLLEDARRRGHRTVDGLGMLLHQAASGFEAWFGTTPTVDAALREHVLSA